jgi:hypothetical protein
MTSAARSPLRTTPAGGPAPPAPDDGGAIKALADELTDIMNGLLGILEVETELVRAGRLKCARGLEARKAELAARYLAQTLRLKASAGPLRRELPETLARLERQHDVFRALLQINLTVLATAHAVAEGIIRGAVGEVGRKLAPQTYGAGGRPSQPPAKGAQPVLINRNF